MARFRKCDGVICGHIHQPAIKNYNGIEYLNSGDWVESMSALVETIHGEWKLIYYNESFNADIDSIEDADDSLFVFENMTKFTKDITIYKPRLASISSLLNL